MLLQNIKASAYLSRIPIMMLSGLEKSAERIKCFELGALQSTRAYYTG